MSKHYHFIGIGGVGMGALAQLVLAKGNEVSGSDLRDNQIVKSLRDLDVKVFLEHDPQNIEGADYIVFSSAIDENNPEMKAAIRRDVPVMQRAELLAELMEDFSGITVAGAHGKTTTTSLVSHLLQECGLNPTTAVGGAIRGASSGARLGDGEYFVAEVDESDGSFLYFSPKYSIITNIDFEHIDYYRNWDNIINAYREFIEKTQDDGIVLVYGGDERLLKLANESKKNVKTYGFASHNEFIAKNIRAAGFNTLYDCFLKETLLGTIELPTPGKHNVLNSLATVALGLHLSIDFDDICKALKTYGGVKRRFQLIDHINDIYVVDDYAHHPTEIKATLEAAKAVATKRQVVVFQPHRYSRLKSLEKEFIQALKEADHLVVTDIYAASEKPIEGLSIQNIVAQLKALRSGPTEYCETTDLVDHLCETAKSGDLILTLGAGDITQVAHEFARVYKMTHRDTFEVINSD